MKIITKYSVSFNGSYTVTIEVENEDDELYCVGFDYQIHLISDEKINYMDIVSEEILLATKIGYLSRFNEQNLTNQLSL